MSQYPEIFETDIYDSSCNLLNNIDYHIFLNDLRPMSIYNLVRHEF